MSLSIFADSGKPKFSSTPSNPHGETVTTAGNQPLPLDDAGAVWRVVSGQVDVFYIHPEPGQSRGSRQHLCRVEEGGSIFAIDGVRGTHDGGLLAVGVGPATLLKFPKADLVRLSLQPVWRHGVAEMIDDWIERVSRASDPGVPPRRPRSARSRSGDDRRLENHRERPRRRDLGAALPSMVSDSWDG